MLRLEASSSSNSKDIIKETCNINLNSILKIENQLRNNRYDMISLVFLLYDEPHTALQGLIVHERVMSEVSDADINLLQKWHYHANNRPNWQHELLEALMICQLYSIVKSLGFHIPSLRIFYQSRDPINTMYINPVKKVLYQACESISSMNLKTLKKTLLTYDINVMEHTTCELIFLELLSKKFITINIKDPINQDCSCNVENLVKILDNLNGLKKIANILRNFKSNPNNEELDIFQSSSGCSTSYPVSTSNIKLKQDNQNYGVEDFNDIFEMINNMSETCENNL